DTLDEMLYRRAFGPFFGDFFIKTYPLKTLKLPNLGGVAATTLKARDYKFAISLSWTEHEDHMKEILGYALGSVLSFLPPRYRPKLGRSVGIISGIVEIFVADFLLILRAINFMQSKMDVDFRSAAVVAGSSVFGSGIFVLVEFWLNPLHCCCSTF